MTRSRVIRQIVLALVLLSTAGCDQVAKHFARVELGPVGSLTLPGRFFEFTLAENPGAFLSLGASLPPVARSALTFCLGIGLASLLAYLVGTPGLRFPSFFGLAWICAGGLSNLIDRFARQGLVTDFMVVRLGPLHTGVFNLADFVIVVGMLIFAFSIRAREHGLVLNRSKRR